jgi:Tol biopolymer transport system component
VSQLDVARGELVGQSAVLADSVGLDGTLNLGAFSASTAGHVAYRPGGAGRLVLTWFDRTGKAVGRTSEPDINGQTSPELSSRGQVVALSRSVQSNQDIWLLDLSRGGFTRLTFAPGVDTNPVWSPDDTQIVFSSNRTGPFNLYISPAGQPGAEKLLLETPNTKVAQDWSKDGRFLLYYELDPKTGRDLWALDLSGNERKPFVVANTPFEESLAQFSPDGRWIAYQTNATGRFEIVVRSFPGPSGPLPVSTGSGVAPRWSANGKELYFIAPDGSLMAAAVTTSGAAFEATIPVKLFSTQIRGGGAVATNRAEYAVSRDGGFLINQVADEQPAPIIMILNVDEGSRGRP